MTQRPSPLILLLALACSAAACSPAVAPEAHAPASADSAGASPSSAAQSSAAQSSAAQSSAAQSSAAQHAPTGSDEVETQTETETEPSIMASDAEAGGSKAAPSEPAPARDVIYKVTPDGLVVEADGVRFLPKAKPVKLANGGYGIHLEVTAMVIDERAHTLLGHTHGPLSIAALIKDAKDRQTAQHTDTRGDGPRTGELEILQPGQDVVLTRSWPSGSVKGPLWWGQKVRLQVGLWGLGADDETPRPLRKLCTVDMVAGAKPTAVVSPPEL